MLWAQSWTFISCERIPLEAYQRTALSLVVIKHEVGHRQILGARLVGRDDVSRAESWGREHSASQGEVLEHSSSQDWLLYVTRAEVSVVVLGESLYFGVIWDGDIDKRHP
jgi:hypothetical protein